VNGKSVYLDTTLKPEHDIMICLKHFLFISAIV